MASTANLAGAPSGVDKAPWRDATWSCASSSAAAIRVSATADNADRLAQPSSRPSRLRSAIAASKRRRAQRRAANQLPWAACWASSSSAARVAVTLALQNAARSSQWALSLERKGPAVTAISVMALGCGKPPDSDAIRVRAQGQARVGGHPQSAWLQAFRSLPA